MSPGMHEPGSGANGVLLHTNPSPDQSPGNDPTPVEVPQPEPTPAQDPIPHQTPLTGVYRLFSLRASSRQSRR